MASLLPLYLKEFYKNEPLFNESKIITSIYNQSFDGTLDKNMIGKVKFDNIDEEIVKVLDTPNYNNLMKIAIDHSDALIKGSQEIPNELEDYLKASKKPVLDYFSPEEFAEPYTEFYNSQF